MKNKMKLSLAIISCISATAYSAEKPNADKIIRESHATGQPIPAATVNQLLQQQKERVAREGVDFLIQFGRPVPEKIIRDADPETVALAHKHNNNLQQHLHGQQPK